VKPIPEGYHTITPCLTVRDLNKAIEFYGKALGATKLCEFSCPESGKVMHAEISIGDSRIMLGEENVEKGCLSPLSLKGSACTLYVYVEDVDTVFNRAVGAGGKLEEPLTDSFWGDRTGLLSDPFGYRWMIATRKENLTEAQIRERAEESMAATAKTT
jgi:PhnB protein